MAEPIDPNPPDWYLRPAYEPATITSPTPNLAPRRRPRPTPSAIAICCLVLAAVGVGVFFLVHKPHRAHRLPIPLAFDGYTQINSPDTDRLESQMRSLAGRPDLFDSASIGFYSHNTGDVPRLIVVVFPAAEFSGGADEAMNSITSGLDVLQSQLVSYPPGPRGGTSRCGRPQLGSLPAALCAWADTTSAGAIISPLSLSPARLAQIERDFRSRLPV
jgi:hypothetical protein